MEYSSQIKSPLLSIVVPVYNTESYIERCLDSLIFQSYKNIEIIIINDCSTDKSENIIKKYLIYPNILYKKFDKNCGVGVVRQAGLNLAHGDLVAFIDSDDWVDLDFYEHLVDAIINNSCDIAIGNVLSEWNNATSSKPRYTIAHDNVISGDFTLKLMSKYYLQNFYISPNMNNRVYRKKLLLENNACSDYARQAQDNYSSFVAFVNAKKVALVSQSHYHYFQREYSAVHSFSEKYINNYFDVLVHIKQYLTDQKIFGKYKSIFICFVDRSVAWLFDCFQDTACNEIKRKIFLKLIFQRCFELFSLDEYIDYLDYGRIMNLFHD